MPSYKTRDLSKQPLPTSPPLAPLRGGRLARAGRLNAVLGEQDRVLGHGRRVLLSVGLHGSSEFLIPSSAVVSLSQAYPTKGHEQIVARAKVALTPGHMPAAVLTALPSGPRQRNSGGTWVLDGAGGRVEIEYTWTNGGDTESQTLTLTPPVSQHDDFTEPLEASAGWTEIHTLEATPTVPNGFTTDLGERVKWGEDVELEITVRYIDAPRVIDLCIFEAPTQYAREQDDDGTFTLHCHTVKGAPLPAYPSPYPIQKLSEAAGGDYTGGSLQALAVADRQAKRLGPCIVSWSTWNDATASVTDTENDAIVFSTTTLTTPDGDTDYDADRRGWSAASGGTARRHNTAGEHQILRDVAAVVEVIVRVRAAVSVGDTGRVVIMAGPESRVEVAVSGASYAWHEQRGTLRCGVAADDPIVWQLFGAVDTGGGTDLSLRDVQIYYASTER